MIQVNAGDLVTRTSDPQGVLARPATFSGATVSATVGNLTGNHMLFAYCATSGGLRYIQPIKVNISSPVPPPGLAVHPSNDTACWSYVPLGAALNADVGGIYEAGKYLSPRPATCAARIGSDGWSAWTFTYGQGTKPPVPNFGTVPSLLGPDGAVVTPRGERFRVAWNTTPNIAFTSQWDNYPNRTIINLNASASTEAAWVLVAGSTNPMQTLLANAQLQFGYSDGVVETLDLVPPTNFWSLSHYGGADYDYATDAFCLPPNPPAQVQLGDNLRAMVYPWPLRQDGARLVSVALETMSLEVVVGLLAVSLMQAPGSVPGCAS